MSVPNENAETYREMAERLASALHYIENSDTHTAIVVGHGLSGQELLRAWLRLPLDAKIAFKPYKNIALNMYGGYFITGGFFDQSGGCAAGTVISSSSAVCSGTSNTTDSFVFRMESIVTF